MARLNNIIKFILLNVNILLCFIGTFFMGLAFYLWFANWGSLDPSFFIGFGFLSILLGFSLAFLSCIGCQGINTQIIKFGKFWTGRKIIAVHLVGMFLCLMGEIYILRLSITATKTYGDIAGSITRTNFPPYVVYENLIEKKFNQFFFGATSACKTTFYIWFWNWVNQHCPNQINQQSCQSCETYSLTFCQANENLCNDVSKGQFNNPYCPYTTCRAGVLNYFQYRVEPFAYGLIAIIILQGFFLFLDLALLCFHPRDRIETILQKSGTLKSKGEITQLIRQDSRQDSKGV